jgi:hypothetical protein
LASRRRTVYSNRLECDQPFCQRIAGKSYQHHEKRAVPLPLHRSLSERAALLRIPARAPCLHRSREILFGDREKGISGSALEIHSMPLMASFALEIVNTRTAGTCQGFAALRPAGTPVTETVGPQKGLPIRGRRRQIEITYNPGTVIGSGSFDGGRPVFAISLSSLRLWPGSKLTLPWWWSSAFCLKEAVRPEMPADEMGVRILFPNVRP